MNFASIIGKNYSNFGWFSVPRSLPEEYTIPGGSRWLFTVANWNCREAVSVIIGFCYQWISALLKKLWYFDICQSAENVKKEKFWNSFDVHLILRYAQLGISRM